MNTISKNWLFNLELSGYGDTPEEARAEAIEAAFEQLDEVFDENNMPDYKRHENGDFANDDDDEE